MIQPQIERVACKLQRFERDLDAMLFRTVGTLDFGAYLTREREHSVPSAQFEPCGPGYTWGGAGQYVWFRGTDRVPAELDGMRLFIMPQFGGYEGFLYVNGEPFGNFAQRITFTAHGNHYCKMFSMQAKAGEVYDLAVECYAGHDYSGKMPEDDYCRSDFRYTVGTCKICVKNDDVWDFYYNLKVLNELWSASEPDTFVRGRLANVLLDLDKTLYLSAADCAEETFIAAIKEANAILRKALYESGCGSHGCGEARIIGHSHMDTAWLWTIDETVVKCARTYANQLALMEQYPEYLFVQSSPYHTELIRRYYPSLFERLKARVKEGRYELNGGAWIECDCNVTGGESMIRQFVWGQRYLQQQFGVQSNTFWLPDTFGYSGAIPQIMKGCGIDYFCTTKMEWADIDEFPCETFIWKGIDGTSVFSHFNKTNLAPAPQDLITYVSKPHFRNIRRRDVTQMRLISFGNGDGGGGPETGMLETARRCADLEGCPKTRYQTVGSFMRELERTAVRPPVWEGELYLNAHRGTLTTQQKIKRNHRLAEQALYRAEYAEVLSAVHAGRAADGGRFRGDVETMLVNQFHDILPGTCIPEVNEKVLRQMPEIIARFDESTAQNLGGGQTESVLLWNPLSFARQDPVRIHSEKMLDMPCPQQRIRDLYGDEYIAAALPLEAFGSAAFRKGAEKKETSVFERCGDTLVTPYARVKFAPDMTIRSFVDRRNGFELRGGENLNTLLFGEDYPLARDNWDIDADIELKLKNASHLAKSEVVADGAVEYRIRNTYRISEKSVLRQDMVFYAATPRVDFECELEWGDTHRLLKVAFDTNLHAPHARSEVQFGYVLRPTTRNTTAEQEMFEALCHKYTDLSETERGAALLNDCKYGMTVCGGNMRLSLVKSGTHPDPSADHGVHRFRYAFLPHIGGFSAQNVVMPAYEFNQPVCTFRGGAAETQLFSADSGSVIVESVKPCEDTQKAYIVRLYESANTCSRATLAFRHAVSRAEETDMLERKIADLSANEKAHSGFAASFELTFRPFEIKTVKIYY